MAFLGGDEVGAIVIDVGTTLTKIGFAGEAEPKSCFPSAVGITYEGNNSVVGEGSQTVGDDMEVEGAKKLPAGPNKKKHHVGTENLSHRRDHLEIHYPLEEGLVKDWDLMESLWGFGLNNRLRIDPKEYALLMVEPSFNTRQNREKLTELIFEKYEAPALFLAKDAVLSCFACGRTTGLVIDSGGGKTSTQAVYEGYVLQQSIRRSPFASLRLDNELLLQLQSRYSNPPIIPSYQITKRDIGAGKFKVTLHQFPNTHPSYSNFRLLELASDIRQTICSVSPIPYEVNGNLSVSLTPYELPDGRVIDIGVERLLIPELMFSPHLAKGPAEKGVKGLSQMVTESIDHCDVDIRRELWNGIVVTGGNTFYPGIVERLKADLSPSHTVKPIYSNSSIERRCSAWIGGSILGSLGTFQQMWMSKAEYEERGKSLVERKCP